MLVSVRNFGQYSEMASFSTYLTTDLRERPAEPDQASIFVPAVADFPHDYALSCSDILRLEHEDAEIRIDGHSPRAQPNRFVTSGSRGMTGNQRCYMLKRPILNAFVRR